MEAFTLLELQNRVKRALLLNFEKPIWVKSEISQIQERRGNYYATLIQQNKEGELEASSSMIIWRSQFSILERHYGDLLHDILKPGLSLHIECKVSYDARYGFSLILQNIDPEHTLGALHMQRLETIQRLEKEGLTDLNKELAIPSPIRKIAVISSSVAAGWADFHNEIKSNVYGYTFDIDFYHAAVQGKNAQSEIIQAFDYIFENLENNNYACVVLLRGGGSKVDLAVFDLYEIAEKIALSPLPVITAIGHETDISIVDMIANTSVKTPTAAALEIIQRNIEWEHQLQSLAQNIEEITTRMINEQRHHLALIKNRIEFEALNFLNEKTYVLQNLRNGIETNTFNNIRELKERLKIFNYQIEASNPTRILNQGYTLTSQKGKWIKALNDIDERIPTKLRFSDGEIVINK